LFEEAIAEMIASDVTIRRLADDLAFVFFVPICCLLFGFANSRLPWNYDDREFRMRLALALAVLFFAFDFCAIVVRDRATLILLWQESPILYSLVYLVSGVLSIVGTGAAIYFKLRPALWRRRQ
jgi:hypothetical protein